MDDDRAHQREQRARRRSLRSGFGSGNHALVSILICGAVMGIVGWFLGGDDQTTFGIMVGGGVGVALNQEIWRAVDNLTTFTLYLVAGLALGIAAGVLIDFIVNIDSDVLTIFVIALTFGFGGKLGAKLGESTRPTTE